MIVLDTNVVSALMLEEPDVAVMSWLDDQPTQSIWITAVTVYEVTTGLELLGATRRRQRLEADFERLLGVLDGRVLAFDRAAAAAAGSLTAQGRRTGRSVEVRDAQIGGIALARKATLATRNTRHFRDLGVRLTDPWKPPPRKR